MQDARDSALSIVKGHRVEELMSIGEEIYDEYMAGQIWPGTRALAQAHLDAGQRVWLVTAAPVETATIIARRLGPDRRARHGGRVRRRRLHRQARRRAAARPGEGRGGTGAGRRRGPGPVALRRLQRLGQRHPDALPGRPPVRDQPRLAPAQARPRRGLAAARLPHRPQGGQDRHPGRRRAWARSRAARWRPPRSPAATATPDADRRPGRRFATAVPRRRASPSPPTAEASYTGTTRTPRDHFSERKRSTQAMRSIIWSIAITHRKWRKRRFEQLGVASPVRSVILLRRIPVPTRRHDG